MLVKRCFFFQTEEVYNIPSQKCIKMLQICTSWTIKLSLGDFHWCLHTVIIEKNKLEFNFIVRWVKFLSWRCLICLKSFSRTNIMVADDRGNCRVKCTFLSNNFSCSVWYFYHHSIQPRSEAHRSNLLVRIAELVEIAAKSFLKVKGLSINGNTLGEASEKKTQDRWLNLFCLSLHSM